MLVKVTKEYPHDTQNYTQGLEFNNGKLYEGTGDPSQQGKTVVGQIDLKTGGFSGLKNGLDQTYFGEGITIFGNELFQLTWRNGKCFVYDKNTMQLKRDISYTGDGWGLCNDGKALIMSDGTERIYFRNPKTFQIIRTIDVYDNVGPRTFINELEFVNGKIYANIYQTNTIIAIDPLTGKVLEEIDASALEISGKSGGDVLNGIAFNPLTNKTYLTGKYWSKLFEVQFIPVQ
jgi:glutamine cyclotransferase